MTLTGISDTGATIPLLFRGYGGVTSGNNTVAQIRTGKTDGGTGVVDVSFGDRVFEVTNSTGAIKYLAILLIPCCKDTKIL